MVIKHILKVYTALCSLVVIPTTIISLSSCSSQPQPEPQPEPEGDPEFINVPQSLAIQH